MSARDEVLAAVRSALAGSRDGAASAAVCGHAEHAVTGRAAAGDGPAYTGVQGEAVLELFVERVADYRAEVTRCAAGDLESVVAQVLDGVDGVVVPAGLGFAVPGAILDEGLSHAELDAIGAVVTGAAVGIAATGTVVLDHGLGQGRRVITLLPDLHVLIVREEQVVADVPDALPRLEAQRPMTWTSGPSATSDIELQRVEGVHGPRQLHVILVAG